MNESSKLGYITYFEKKMILSLGHQFELEYALLTSVKKILIP